MAARRTAFRMMSSILVIVLAATAGHAAHLRTALMSRTSTGGNANAQSGDPAISADGRHVAFWSDADNLVPGDTNGVSDMFVRDRKAGALARVSVSSGGVEGNGPSPAPLGPPYSPPALSGDGRYVAFESSASNLVAGDTNGWPDVFVRDRQTDTTSRVSVAAGGAQSDRGGFAPSISANGRYVAFESDASNLVAGCAPPKSCVYVHDRQTGTTELASKDSAGVAAAGDSYWAAISGDGRAVAFLSQASTLVPGDTNQRTDVFVHDRQTGATTRVSVAPDGSELSGTGEEFWFRPSISGNARYVAFVDGNFDLYVRDRVNGTTSRVPTACCSSAPAISGNGRFVAYSVFDQTLNAGDTNLEIDVFVHDLTAGTTTRVSVASDGTEADGPSLGPAISASGRHVAFWSDATNLVRNDTNSVTDVFVRDRGPACSDAVREDGSLSGRVHEVESGLGPGETVAHALNCDLAGLGL